MLLQETADQDAFVSVGLGPQVHHDPSVRSHSPNSVSKCYVKAFKTSVVSLVGWEVLINSTNIQNYFRNLEVEFLHA